MNNEWKPLESHPGRLHHLDSLRGIAALGVAFQHSTACFEFPHYQSYIYSIFGLSPVVFFFLLSGFVLSRSLDSRNQSLSWTVINYSIRRVFRLYPAALLALIVAAIFAHWVLPIIDWSDYSAWLREIVQIMRSHDNLSSYIHSLLLVDAEPIFNPPLWTIREEFACSLLLPFMVLLLGRFPKLLMPSGAVLAFFLWKAHYHQLGSYMFSFYVGYLIHKSSGWFHFINERATKWALFFGVMLWVFSIKQGFNAVTGSVTLGFILLVLVPCRWPRLHRLLESSPLRFLGKISYSFYLLHFPLMLLSCVLLTRYCTHFLTSSNHTVTAAVVFSITVVATLILGAMSEFFVEGPWNQLGRMISCRILSRGKSLFNDESAST